MTAVASISGTSDIAGGPAGGQASAQAPEDAAASTTTMYELLKTIDDPADLRRLDRKALGQLAEELR